MDLWHQRDVDASDDYYATRQANHRDVDASDDHYVTRQANHRDVDASDDHYATRQANHPLISCVSWAPVSHSRPQVVVGLQFKFSTGAGPSVVAWPQHPHQHGQHFPVREDCDHVCCESWTLINYSNSFYDGEYRS